MSTYTLAISPERDIEPGTHIRAFVTIGDSSTEPTPVTLRVAIESRGGPVTGSTQARWAVTADDEIEFVFTFPSSRVPAKAAVAIPSEPARTVRTEPVRTAIPESVKAMLPEPGATTLPEPEASMHAEAMAAYPAQVSAQALRLLQETRFLGLLRHLFAIRAFAAEGVFPEKARAQLDRLYIKLRLPNYSLSERDIDASPTFWLEQARQLPPELRYKAPLVEAFEELCDREPAAFLDALQHAENRDLDAALDGVLESLGACS